jgi:hypothetical protein
VDNLYSDEALYDELLRAAKMKQICQKCGYEIGREVAGFNWEEGSISFKKLCFKKYCSDCRLRVRKPRTKKPKEPTISSLPEPPKAPVIQPASPTFVPPTWDELEAMIKK